MMTDSTIAAAPYRSRNLNDLLVARSFVGGIEIADDGGYLLIKNTKTSMPTGPFSLSAKQTAG
jgi:hypothetical protein